MLRLRKYRKGKDFCNSFYRNQDYKFRHTRRSKWFKDFEGNFLPMRKVKNGISYKVLQRFLMSKVGCEWDAVYSEICMRVGKKDSREMVLKQMSYFVVINATSIEGKLYEHTHLGLYPIEKYRHTNWNGKIRTLYVENGILRIFENDNDNGI